MHIQNTEISLVFLGSVVRFYGSGQWSCDCRQHGGLTELNSRLVESLQLYHTLMQELPSYSQPGVHNMPTYMSLSQVTTEVVAGDSVTHTRTVLAAVFHVNPD